MKLLACVRWQESEGIEDVAAGQAEVHRPEYAMAWHRTAGLGRQAGPR